MKSDKVNYQFIAIRIDLKKLISKIHFEAFAGIYRKVLLKLKLKKYN